MQGKYKANRSPPLIQLDKSIVNNIFINIANNPMCVFFFLEGGGDREGRWSFYTVPRFALKKKVIKICTRKLTMSEQMVCPVNHHFLQSWGQNCEGVSLARSG